MSETDRLNVLSILDSTKKVLEYSKGYSNADQFYNSQKDFDAAMMNFIIIGEMVSRLSEKFLQKYDNIEWQKIQHHIPILQIELKNIRSFS
jgi:uncharacterized protein with HEPN domain